MTEHEAEIAIEKAKAFFDRGEQVAATDNFDYAIDMYLEGLKRAPDALEDGHVALRRVSLIRQGKGGKKPSVVDKIKKRGAKGPLEEMLKAEYLLAKDPDNLIYAEKMLSSALEGGWKRTAEWIADLVFSELRNQDKPSVAELELLKDGYAKLEKFDKAVAACVLAAKMKPEDGFLADEVKNMSARAVMFKGKYDQGGDFSGSIKNKESQDKLHSQDAVVKTADYRMQAVDAAREKLVAEPDSYVVRVKLCDALVDLGTNDGFLEAVSLLKKYHLETDDFAYKRYLGEIEIKYYRKKLSAAKAKISKNPADLELKNHLSLLNAKVSQLEFEHFKMCVKVYPTDLKFKYELALRYVLRKGFDDAIPLFQEARREPRLKFFAMDKLGICFFHKGWYDDAIDIFNEAIGNYEIEDDSLGKELKYNLARSYEESGDIKSALEVFRKLGQLDYSYKDVRQRIDILRAKMQ